MKTGRLGYRLSFGLLGSAGDEYSPVVEKSVRIFGLVQWLVSVAVIVPSAATAFAGDFAQPAVALIAGVSTALAVTALLYLGTLISQPILMYILQTFLRLVMYMLPTSLHLINRMRHRNAEA